ncbi:MAG: sugar phosphate isomerase/epimerase [Verrucomicrobiales bacterium]|nr:sugar phosphate isomerase/epimerase [Verrucomicrobiales bacterium]
MNRRHFLTTSLAAASVASAPCRISAAPPGRNHKLGITLWSYNIRWRNREKVAPQESWKDALDVLDHCDDLGAGCLQIGVRKWSDDFTGKVRDRRESYGIALEGQVGLPRMESDLDRFEADIKAAKEAGATTVRCVCQGGRRYEIYKDMEEWNTFVHWSKEALERAEPIMARHGVRLAIENHKDWRADEHLALLEHLDSEWIGVTFDFGNNYALLEDPHEVAEALAPYIFSTHVKDMELAPSEEGFLLSEVPLGQGRLDLAKILEICASRNPEVWFNLEMITRDPLVVPVLEDRYWRTMASIPAPDLAETLQTASKGKPGNLPHVGGRDLTAQLAWEDENVRKSFDYAREKLGFS